MQTWLKLIGSSKEPVTGHPFYGIFKDEKIGFRKERRPSIQLGDRVFLYAPGGSQKIFALADVVSNPFKNPEFDPGEEGSCFWHIRLHYQINMPVNSGIDIEAINTKKRNLLKSIQRQSHIRLSQEEIELAFTKLEKKATR